MDEPDVLLTTSELGRLFNVSAKAVTRYADEKGLPHVWTPGGHRRYWKRAAMAWYDKKLEQATAKNKTMGGVLNNGSGRATP